MNDATNDPRHGSSLLVDEFFETSDERFLDEVLRSASAQKLAALAERWYADWRPFARRALLGYIADGCDRAHHRPLVKHLFKLAEAAGDDEAISEFLLAFDRLIRRRIVNRASYDWKTSRVVHSPALILDSSIPAGTLEANSRKRFSRKTRMYLVRRAFRYFRNLGYRDPVRFRALATRTLARYRDEHLTSPERLIDAWGLVHLLYWGSPAIRRPGSGICVAPGHSLAQLQPAPIHPDAWKNCLDDVLMLVHTAQSRTVRAWAIGLLRQSYSSEIPRFDTQTLRKLLGSPHDEVRTFAIEALRASERLADVSIEDWLALLAVRDLDVVTAVCDFVREHLSPARLTLTELVDVTCASYAPVAEIGFEWISRRRIGTPEDLRTVLRLGTARVPDVRARAAGWLGELIAQSTFARAEDVRELIDARHEEFRSLGLGLFDRDERFRGSLAIARALAESPYDDVRRGFVERLRAWERDFDPSALQFAWASAMLAVHRGGRVKAAVLDQLSSRLARHPGEARELLPVLAVALRSVRPAERRAALASIVRAALRAPELAEPIARALPELRVLASREVRA